MLENTELQEFVVWRTIDFDIRKTINGEEVATVGLPDKIFVVGDKRFVQRFAWGFNDCFNYPSPDITFFRGGFPEYAKLIKAHAKYFGLKLYYGAGQRIQPQYGGVYDKILVEDERDYGPNTIPFYKTANPNIFHPMNLEKKWDICWPCNFAQLKYKGQEWFIGQIAKSDYLRMLKILHIGDKPDIGKELCKKYNVNNVDFKGWMTRQELNKYLNQSKIGLVTSNELDGSPRVITEILCSGIPLLKRIDTRAIMKYLNSATFTGYNTDKENRFKIDYLSEKSDLDLGDVSMDHVCRKNLELWK